MIKNLDELIWGAFDFDLEDQPDKISGYDDIIKTMWLESSIQNLDEKVYLCIQEIVESKIDPEEVINFYFMSNKHDKRNLLIYANNYYITKFLPFKDVILKQKEVRLKGMIGN